MEKWVLEDKWPLGHVYDLTECFTNKVINKEIVGANYEHGYFVCRDVWDIHVYRVLSDTNSDFETEEGTWLVEQNDIRYNKFVDFLEEIGIISNRLVYNHLDEREMLDKLLRQLSLKTILHAIILYDYDSGFENYDNEEFSSHASCIEAIDDGYGITVVNM